MDVDLVLMGAAIAGDADTAAGLALYEQISEDPGRITGRNEKWVSNHLLECDYPMKLVV
jgi:hypothetical protein